MSGRKETEEVVKLSYFADIGKAIASAANLTETMRAIMDKIGEIFAPTYWSILLRDLKTGELEFSMVVGSGVEDLKGVRLPRGKGIAGWIAENGEPLMIEDVGRDSRFESGIDEQTQFTTKSIIGVPLKTQRRVFGVIELINALEKAPFTAYDLKILSTIGDFAAIAIEKVYYLTAYRRMATTDALTGVYNRRSFDSFFDRELEKTRRKSTVMSLLMVDIDDFKEINDRHGHEAGDRALIRVAETLKNNTRKVDYVCRYGGDEFVVLMPDTTRQAAERIRDRIVDRIEADNTTVDVQVSLSLGLQDSAETDLTELLASADRAMYRSKGKKPTHPLSDIGSGIGVLLDEESGTTSK